jgi:ribosome-associated toxin RatA of RatAB toxin-antitoxin module
MLKKVLSWVDWYFHCSIKPIHLSLITRLPGHEVSITQAKGPFLDFHALWSLEAIDENQTKVRFKTTFTLPFALSIFATQSLIDKIGHKFINAFATQLLK